MYYTIPALIAACIVALIVTFTMLPEGLGSRLIGLL